MIEPELEVSSKVYPTENPDGTVEPVVGVIAENTGAFASIPGAVPAAMLVSVLLGLPAASFSVMLTGSIAASEMFVFPSTTV